MKEKEKIKLLERIDRYIKGDASQDEIDELWKLFLQHPEWYDWFETELHLQSLIRKGKKPNFEKGEEIVGSQPDAVKGYRVWIYAAAAAVLLAIGLQFFSFEQYEPIPSLAFTEIGQENLIGADVLRSGEDTAEELDVAINEALATAYDGETTQAIEEFRELLNQSSSDQQQARIEMNLGILFFNNEQYESARTHFSSVSEIESLEDYQIEKSLWYLGNTLLKLDQPRDARGAVFKVYHMNGRFQSKAHSLINVLDQQLGNISSDNQPESLGN